MSEKNHHDNHFEESIDNINKKSANDKIKMIEQHNYFIELIYENYIRLLNSLYVQERDEFERDEFERGIHHALTLLAASKQEIQRNGPSSFSNYLVASAVDYIIKYFPSSVVSVITDKLPEINSLHYPKQDEIHTHINKKNVTTEYRYSEGEKTNKLKHPTDKIRNDLLSRLNITSNINKKSGGISKHVIIDFTSDLKDDREYSIKRAQILNANLFHAEPHHFLFTNSDFAITKGTTITMIGHCDHGLDYLADNTGHKIKVAQLAEQILAKLHQNNTPLDTEFTIDLIACRAASGVGEKESFAKRLARELGKRGINNVTISASPTVMYCHSNGDVSNLSMEDDKKFDLANQPLSRQNFFSSFCSFFTRKNKFDIPRRLNIAKEQFHSAKTN